MRLKLKTAAAVAVMMATGGGVHAQTAAHYPTWTGDWEFPDDDAIARAYPEKALSERVEGSATIDCAVKQSGDLTDCLVINEAPKGYGFGQAAANLFMSATSVEPASVPGGLQAGDRKKFTFMWTPPEGTDPANLGGDWTIPDQGDMTKYFPQAAENGHGVADVTIDCTVAPTGKLSACRTIREDPPGYGFGRATVDMFKRYAHVDPQSVPGGIPKDAHKKFTLRWVMP